MQDLGGGEWAGLVDAYLATKRGADTSAYAREQLYAQDGVGLGFSGARHGLDEVHSFRMWLESIAPRGVLAPLSDCGPSCEATLAHELAHWLMTAGSRTS